MATEQTSVHLNRDELRSLERLAAREGRSVGDLIHLAVQDFLARRSDEDAAWRERFDRLLERIQSRVPPDIPPDEIEADISAARQEVRQARRARRR